MKLSFSCVACGSIAIVWLASLMFQATEPISFTEFSKSTPRELIQTVSYEAPTSKAVGENTLGIVKEKPTSGRFVEIEGGYMVPYTATIPGTEIQFEMIPVPGGKFMMGSPEDEDDRRDDEGPQFEVSVEPFWMGKHEVTWLEYKKYMQL